ncbi:polynucleotide adenylyltransferase PcnB [Allohahella marinimesophila]|uniref:Poly(A) polymerase I n=1 Tax=Allohahella marinimesophila TaxID=1054972 RepID=A0ABP7P5S3_9GAMM
MLRKLLGFARRIAAPQPQAAIPQAAMPASHGIDKQIIPRDQHSVSRKQISSAALKVLYRLNASGYQAYLVGGGVRDLLLGGHPKDFDIATDAHPEIVDGLFSNARLIGRRFKLVHVRFGREIIEVATFRASADLDDEHLHEETGRILRDNTYGNQDEDAARRDFSVNALYYDISDFSIHAYANGLEDLNNKVLRLIGDPAVRYREDPVRMLRAARFAAKLGFTVDKAASDAIYELGELLAGVPSARLFDEALKLFMSGYGQASWKQLEHFNLLQYLLAEGPQAPTGLKLALLALASTDSRVAADKPVTPAFIYAAFLWEAFSKAHRKMLATDVAPQDAFFAAADSTVARQLMTTSIPKRFTLPMKEVWGLQSRLERHSKRNVKSCLFHPRFRAAYDFLLLREAAGEDTEGAGQWWTDYISSDEGKMLHDEAQEKHAQQRNERREASGGRDDGDGRKRPRRRRGRKPQNNG